MSSLLEKRYWLLLILNKFLGAFPELEKKYIFAYEILQKGFFVINRSKIRKSAKIQEKRRSSYF